MAVFALVDDVDAEVNLALDDVHYGALQNVVELRIGDGAGRALEVSLQQLLRARQRANVGGTNLVHHEKLTFPFF